MKITEYKEYDQEEILEFYRSVGWTNYTEHPERLQNGNNIVVSV